MTLVLSRMAGKGRRRRMAVAVVVVVVVDLNMQALSAGVSRQQRALPCRHLASAAAVRPSWRIGAA